VNQASISLQHSLLCASTNSLFLKSFILYNLLLENMAIIRGNKGQISTLTLCCPTTILKINKIMTVTRGTEIHDVMCESLN
jgi:hypothetical protein